MQLPELNLPKADLKIKTVEGKPYIFDICRKRFVRLTPEEWVRQNLIAYLVQSLNYPIGLTAVECKVAVGNLNQRADLVAYSNQLQPLLIAECKSPQVTITKSVFEQALRYNTTLKVKYLLVSNGKEHYCAHISDGQATMLNHIPTWMEINSQQP